MWSLTKPQVEETIQEEAQNNHEMEVLESLIRKEIVLIVLMFLLVLFVKIIIAQITGTMYEQ